MEEPRACISSAWLHSSCKPGPSVDSATHIRYTGLVNFTNGDATGPASGNCLVNSLLYNEAQPLQVLGRPLESSTLQCLIACIVF